MVTKTKQQSYLSAWKSAAFYRYVYMLPRLLDCWQSVFSLEIISGVYGRGVLAKGEWYETWARHGFFSPRPFPHSARPPYSTSSLHGQRHLRSQWLNARPNDPQRKNRLPADYSALWIFLLSSFPYMCLQERISIYARFSFYKYYLSRKTKPQLFWQLLRMLHVLL